MLFKRTFLNLGAALVLLVGLSAVDYYSGPDVSVSLFYLLIVAFVAWTTRQARLAVASAIICAAVWLVAEVLTIGAPSTAILVWNALTRLAILVTIALLIARLRAALDTEKALARTDFLTGLLNARAFAELASAEIARARRFDHTLAVAYLDLDDFKLVNDKLGHAQGDTLLREVAQLIRSQLRKTDTIARVGGDEFLVLLPETSRPDAVRAMEKLRKTLDAAMKERDLNVSFSIGVATYAGMAADVQVMIRTADALMYQAKAAGKNCVRFERAETA